LHHEQAQFHTRRHFLRGCTSGLGAIALSSLFGNALRADEAAPIKFSPTNPLSPRPAPLAPRAKRVIYLHMSGSPPQHDLFDYQPRLAELNGKPCPPEFIKNERFA